MAGQEFLYPYTTTAKIRQFPYAWYWKNSRFTRFMAYSLPITLLVLHQIDKAVWTPTNVEKWKKIRAGREHTHFDAPHE